MGFARQVAVAAATMLAAAVPRTDPSTHRFVMLGRSVDGRAITAVETGDPDSPSKTLVVGCIHGDERAGIAIAAALDRMPPPDETDLWVVPVLNPDGAVANTRQNAHGVDLNRNFPWRWRRERGVFASGPRPLSEPESRIAYRLIERVRPSVSIWFHQHRDVVDGSTGNVALERRFARVAGMHVARLAREPGSAVSWETHVLPRSSSFVVELRRGTLLPSEVSSFVRAIGAVSVES